MQAGGLGISGCIQPVPGLVLAVMRAGEEPVDDFFVCPRRIVGEEVGNLLRGRWQAGQIERHPADQRTAVGLRLGSEAAGFELCEDEGIDGGFHPCRLPDLGLGRALRFYESPMLLVLRPLLYPARDEGDLVGSERGLMGTGWRHHLVGIRGSNALDEGAGFRMALHDDREAALARQERELFAVDAEIGLPRGGVLAVAEIAVVRKDGLDVLVEGDLRGEGGVDGRGGARGCAILPAFERDERGAHQRRTRAQEQGENDDRGEEMAFHWLANGFLKV